METTNGQNARNDKILNNEESMEVYTVTPDEKNDNVSPHIKFIINIMEFLEQVTLTL